MKLALHGYTLLTLLCFILIACGGPATPPPPTVGPTETRVAETPSPAETVTATPAPTETPTPPPLDLADAEIAYLDIEHHLWVMNADGTARWRITTCGNVRAFAWSPDGQTLAYLVNGAAWLYDMQNGKCKCLLSALPDHDPGPRLSWSPHKQYLVLNEGTSLSQRLSIIEVATGSVVRKIDVIGYAWSPDEENLLIGKRHHLEKPITVQPGDAVDLAVISPGDPKTPPDVLLEGSAQVLYFPFDWLSDGQIQYSRLDWDEAAQTGEQSYWAAPWKNGELGEPEPISYPYQHNGDAQMRQRIVERLQLGDDYDPGTLYWAWSPDHTHLVIEVEQRGRELYLLEWESSTPPRFLGSGKEPRWRPRRSKPTTLPTASSTAQGPWATLQVPINSTTRLEPGMEGAQVAEAIRAQGLPTRVLGLSAYADDRYVYGMLEAGAAGYLLKEEALERIVAAVRAVARSLER